MDKSRLNILNKQMYKVTKSNEIIQYARNTMTYQQQMIIAYIISHINPCEDDMLKCFEFDVKDFCNVCRTSTHNSTYIKKTLKELYDQPSIWIKINGGYAAFRWIEYYKVDTETGAIMVRLHSDLKPYLLELQSKFTSYMLGDIVNLKSSRYVIPWYELFCSYSSLGTFKMTIDEIRDYFQLGTKYADLRDFNKKVIKMPIDEINNESNALNVTYESIKKGRKITGFKFNIKKYY